jgi:hypothetical protein
MPTPLEQAYSYINAGDIETAKQLLAQILKQNPNDENAWLWMSRCVTTTEQKRYCFDRVLKINPQNQGAIEGLKRLNNPVPPNPPPKVIHQQPIKPVKKKRPDKKRIIAVMGLGVAICSICGVFIILLLNPSNGATTKVLSAEDTFEVSAIDIVKDEGYKVTSAVCEVISPERDVLYGIDLGNIVFHAFRITKDTLGNEVVVLFASNHTASDGNGPVFTVNSEAVRLFPDFPDVSRRSEHPITLNTPGAQDALECAQQAGKPPSLNAGNFDVEAWRREAIKKFGQEQTNSNGSKDDYVRFALPICKQSNAERDTMLTNLGADYEGSFQQFVIETFCPYVK